MRMNELQLICDALDLRDLTVEILPPAKYAEEHDFRVKAEWHENVQHGFDSGRDACIGVVRNGRIVQYWRYTPNGYRLWAGSEPHDQIVAVMQRVAKGAAV